MAKFRDLSQSFINNDRAIGDRQRHINLVKELMRSDLPTLVQELDIFKADKERAEGSLHKISVKTAKEFRFIYDEEKDKGGGAGQGGEDLKEGDVVGKAKESKSGDKQSSPFGGKEAGQMILEMNQEDIDDILDEAAQDLNLPFLSPRKSNRTEVKTNARWRGIKETGIVPRLDLEESYIEKLKRGQIVSEQSDLELGDEEPAFITDDLRYHGLGIRIQAQTNVLLVLIMDKSGSMNTMKKYLAKAFCYSLYNFVRSKYKNAEEVGIAHDTEAAEVSLDDFFRISSDGGTAISSGPRESLKIIKQRYDPEQWDIYAVHCSDGENNPDDGSFVLSAFKDLIATCRLVGFLEIKPDDKSRSALNEELEKELGSEKFKVLFVSKKEDVRKVFDNFLNIEGDI